MTLFPTQVPREIYEQATAVQEVSQFGIKLIWLLNFGNIISPDRIDFINYDKFCCRCTNLSNDLY